MFPFTSYTIPLILSEPLKTPARLQETNQPCLHYPTTHFIFSFSLKLCHQDTFYLNSVWDSGKWNVNWRPNRKMIIYTYFWKQNQLLIYLFFWVLCRRPIKSSPEWTGEGWAKEREKWVGTSLLIGSERAASPLSLHPIHCSVLHTEAHCKPLKHPDFKCKLIHLKHFE